MDNNSYGRQAQAAQRHLASLKLVSRLLGHELHAQGSSKSITLSREEVVEIQSTLDLFIEEMTKRQGGSGSTASAENTRMVTARN